MERNDVIQYVYTKLAEAPTIARERTQAQGAPLKYRRAYFRLVSLAGDFISRYAIVSNGRDRSQETKIILVPGLRGVGKTTTVLQLYLYLVGEMKRPQERVLYFSADEATDYLGVGIYDAVSVFVEDILNTSLLTIDEPVFILIDEAHYDRDWDLAAKMLFDRTRNVFLLLTGSSALSMEMSADLARRSEKEALFPLNFSEYLLLKYGAYAPTGTAKMIHECLFDPSDAVLQGANMVWRELRSDMLQIGTPLEKEFEYYLSAGGFPFGTRSNYQRAFEWTFQMIDRIVDKDILAHESFRAETKDAVTRIIYFLALKRPGQLSVQNLAQNLDGVSRTSINKILQALEKAHLIFSIKPYGEAKKIATKPWKYYFSSPNLNAAIRFKLRKYDLTDSGTLGTLTETLVASYFFRLGEVSNRLSGCFYDPHVIKPQETNSDFLVTTGVNSVIPIEVSVGEKSTRQVKRSVAKYNANHGIIVSHTNEISREGQIVCIPLIFFSFL
jgi:predicted AAA+ superfamily ATPase